MDPQQHRAAVEVVLRIADGLSLPVEAATETFLIVGKRGSGKSSTATRLAEQFIRSKVPIAVLDPVDVWWGLKAGATGTREGGLEVYVFGGEHAELPLEPTAGALMADTIVDHRINAVFVVRQFSNREKARFVTDFAEQMFKRNRAVMHLFVEEAHEFIPQNPYKGEEEMQGRMTKLIREGRTSGIGMSVITQRPASVSTNARTQVEVLVAHRILGKHDRDAIDGWIEHHHLQTERQTVLGSLAELKTGEAWVWSPDFPEEKPLGLRRVNILMPETFDSRRTPKIGEKRREPKSLAPVDLAKLGEKMTATRERAKQTDPKLLQTRVRELEAQLGRVRHEKEVVTRVEQKRVEVPMLKDGQITRLEKLAERLDRYALNFANGAASLKAALSAATSTATRPGPAQPRQAQSSTRDLSVDVGAVRAGNVVAARAPRVDRLATPTVRPRAGGGVAAGVTSDQGARTGLTEPQQLILDVIGELDRRGLEKDRTSVARWLRLHPKGGSYGANLGFLRAQGYLNGFELNGKAAPRPYVDEGIPGALAALPDDPKKLALEAIVEWFEAEGRPASREDIAAKLGLHPKGGSYGENLGWLRAMRIVTKKGLAPTTGLFR